MCSKVYFERASLTEHRHFSTAGILHVILHAPSNALEPHWSKILSTIEWLLAIQDPLGNWPSKASLHMTYISGGAAAQPDSKRLGVDEEHDDALVQ